MNLLSRILKAVGIALMLVLIVFIGAFGTIIVIACSPIICVIVGLTVILILAWNLSSK